MASPDPVPAPGPASQRPALPGAGAEDLASTPVRAVLSRAPVTVPPEATIRVAAERMREHGVSSVLIVSGERLVGILTDRDLRNRVVAAGLDPERPVGEIATRDVLTTDLRTTAFDAMLLMARHNVHHVPVLDEGRVAGMITATDLTARQTASAVVLAGEIHKQASVEDLKKVTGRIRLLQRNLAAADATAYATGQVVTAMTDALTRRLLQMAETRLGPPPVPYVWVAAGSQARCEQTAKSDQDNCMILDDAYDEARHGEYFKALATFVCDGLDACGYIHCPGDMMAMTDVWRQPQRRWRQYFREWILEPAPKALMLTCVFFDLRAVHGQTALLDEVRAEVLELARNNSIFLAYMVGNALTHRPPLNVLGRIATARSGPERGKVDLKHLGVVPIVDLARVYALAGGHAAVNTWDRLETAGGEVTTESARDLRDALEYIAVIRIHHQARQIAAGEAPDNFLAPAELSNFQRSQLRDAFAVVQKLQEVIGQRHQAGRF